MQIGDYVVVKARKEQDVYSPEVRWSRRVGIVARIPGSVLLAPDKIRVHLIGLSERRVVFVRENRLRKLYPKRPEDAAMIAAEL